LDQKERDHIKPSARKAAEKKATPRFFRPDEGKKEKTKGAVVPMMVETSETWGQRILHPYCRAWCGEGRKKKGVLIKHSPGRKKGKFRRLPFSRKRKKKGKEGMHWGVMVSNRDGELPNPRKNALGRILKIRETSRHN